MKKAILFLTAFLIARPVRAASSLAASYASEMIRSGQTAGYVSAAGGATVGETIRRPAYAVGAGVAFPFFRIEFEYLRIKQKETAAANPSDKTPYALDGFFNNYYLGEFVYGGVGFGRGDWDGVTTDMRQYMGGVELPLSRETALGIEYRRIKSAKNGEITNKKFDAQTLMGRLRIHF